MTSDDALLRALGRVAAEEDDLSPDDELLARWCAGTLDADAQQALEARADGDVELARKLDAYRPLDADFRTRLAARAADALSVARLADSRLRPDSPLRADARSRTASRRRAPRVGQWGAGGLTLALAAAVFLWVRPLAHDGGTGGSPIAALPRYEVDAAGGDRDTRGGELRADDHSVRLLRPESRLTLTVRPATAVSGPVTVEAFVLPAADARGQPAAGSVGSVGSAGLSASGAPERLPLTFAISTTGVAHVSGHADELFGGRRGSWELRLLVVRASATAEERHTWASDAATAGEGWQRLDVGLLLVDQGWQRDTGPPR